MRNCYLIFIFLAIVHYSFSQNPCAKNIDSLFLREFTIVQQGGNGGKSIYIKGEKAQEFLQAIINQDTLHTYVTKVKNVSIPGIEKAVTLEIHEGIHGKIPDQNSFYCHTFEDDLNKKLRVDQMTKNEILGVAIYVKKKGNNRIQTDDEANAVIAYIKELLR